MVDRDELIRARGVHGTRVTTDVSGTFSTIRGPMIDPIFRPDLEVIRRVMAPPLALMPLRLEYRVVERRKPPIVTDPRHERPDILTVFPTRRVSIRNMDRTIALRREAISEISHLPITTESATLSTQREIWFRWYPDEGFAEKGIAAATPDELAALAAFDTATGPLSWFDIEEPEVAAAFAELAQATSMERAIHLLRSRPALSGSGDTRIGRIAALPARVALFGVSNAGVVTQLGAGSSIPPGTASQPSPIAYTPAAIETANWLNSFTTALQNGMGLKLQTNEAVSAALNADWIVAVGLHGGDGAAELSALISDGIANGAFGFLPQDTPTNSSISTAQADTPITYVTSAAQMERGAVAASASNAADLFATALGLDPALIRKAVNAADGAFEDARAMLRVIGPVLLDAALLPSLSLKSLDENTLIDIMAATISSRGALPSIRAGRNPFGVLPVTRIRDLKMHGGDETSTEARVHELLRMYTSIAREFQPRIADANVPTLAPDDPNAAETLEKILESNPVSRRIEVSDVGASDPRALGCPYVSSAQRPAAQYLEDLRFKPLRDLPDPTANDHRWPLLYRLARVSLELSTVFFQIRATTSERMTFHEFADLPREEQARRKSLDLYMEPVNRIATVSQRYANLKPETVDALLRTARSFTDGLIRLREIAERPDGTAQLEILMMETLDLFQHRVDAWATGLAYAQLLEMRRSGGQELKAGYYGVLSKLRPKSATGASDGYIQAPGSPQATTAALLRAAHLRYRAEGTFNIDLSSRRLRRALSLLELIRNGLSLPEVLGLRGERWLHDRHHDAIIPRLRELFPISNPAPPENEAGTTGGATKPVTIRLFDGEAFLDSTLNSLSAAERAVAKNLQAALHDDLDALSDLVMCEAVHQRAMGNSGAANAWLQVLSGGHVPGDPVFPRTQRHGQGSSHRVSLLLKPVSVESVPSGSPRELAEPALAAFAEQLLGPTSAASVGVAITHQSTTEQTTSLSLSLGGDLGMRPIDLVIGGESEVRVRARNLVISRWLTDATLAADLGPLPSIGLDPYLTDRVSIALDLSTGSPKVSDLLAQAGRLRDVAQRGRALEASDMSAAAAPDTPLTETVDIALMTAATAELRARAIALGARIDTDRAAFDAAWQTFVTAAREARRAISVPESESAITAAISVTEAARRNLITSLSAVSRYAEPDALRVFTTMDAIANPDIHDESLAAISKRLTRRRAALDAAASAAASGAAASHEKASSIQRSLVEALQKALDGPALVVLPPIAKVPETTPLLNGATTVASALGDWSKVREDVGRLRDLARDMAGATASAVSPKATEDDTGDADPRPEAVAPRSAHFGVFVGDPGLANGLSFTGIVSDEWVEQRPSRDQMSAVAVNYNSPQSEPPHAMLLCVPPDASFRAWDETRAAGMVFEAIQWMKVRALSTDDRITPGAAFPNANQVPPNKNASVQRRIPIQKYKGILVEEIAGINQFVLKEASSRAVGSSGVGIHEITGLYGIKE